MLPERNHASKETLNHSTAQIRLRGATSVLASDDREKLHDIKLLKRHLMIWRVWNLPA